jgi:hypothetical protein
MLVLPFLPREALVRTQEITERCTFNLDFSSFSYPQFPVPGGETATGFLKKLALQKARVRYAELTHEIDERIEDEINLIEQKGLSGYFLVVWDIIEYPKWASPRKAEARRQAPLLRMSSVYPCRPCSAQAFRGTLSERAQHP